MLVEIMTFHRKIRIGEILNTSTRFELASIAWFEVGFPLVASFWVKTNDSKCIDQVSLKDVSKGQMCKLKEDSELLHHISRQAATFNR